MSFVKQRNGADIWSVITNSIPLRRRALLGALGGSFEGIAQGLGPPIGGLITDKIGWHFCFWINLPIGAITLIVIMLFYNTPEQARALQGLTWKQKIAKLDLLSTAVFVPSVVCFLVGLQWGSSTYGWQDGRVIAMFVVFAVLLIPFVYLQYRQGDEATLPARVIGQRSILSGMLFASCTTSSLTVVEYYMPIYNQAILGYTAQASGLLSLSLVVGMFLSILFAGSLTTALGFYNPFMIASSILAPIAAGLLTTLPLERDVVKIILYQSFLGFACGMGFQAPQVAAQTVLAQKDVPLGIAAIFFAQGIGPAVMIAGAQALFQSRLRADVAQTAPGVNTTTLENLGLTDLKHKFGEKTLVKALRGYDEAISQVFYLPLALMCLSLVGSLAMEWRSVKKKTS